MISLLFCLSIRTYMQISVHVHSFMYVYAQINVCVCVCGRACARVCQRLSRCCIAVVRSPPVLMRAWRFACLSLKPIELRCSSSSWNSASSWWTWRDKKGELFEDLPVTKTWSTRISREVLGLWEWKCAIQFDKTSRVSILICPSGDHAAYLLQLNFGKKCVPSIFAVFSYLTTMKQMHVGTTDKNSDLCSS